MTRRIRYDAWSDADDWRSGHRDGTTVYGDALVIGEAGPGPGGGTREALWGSPGLAPGFRFTELVASWSAVTPPGSWIEVRVIGGDPDRPRMDNHLLAEWSSGEHPTRRKGDGWPYDDEVAVDVWRPSKGADTYRLA